MKYGLETNIVSNSCNEHLLSLLSTQKSLSSGECFGLMTPLLDTTMEFVQCLQFQIQNWTLILADLDLSQMTFSSPCT
jgi:hypothetical protein